MNNSLDLMLKFCALQNARYSGEAYAGCRLVFEVSKSKWSGMWLLKVKNAKQ